MIKDVIQTTVDKIKKHRSFYEQSEMAVRDQVVNPILRTLEWDPENPEEVQPNVYSEEGVPDYTLLKMNKKVLFIEAKKLSIDIEKKDVIRQLAGYCFGEGMKYGVLTNGSIWILFRAFQEGTTIAERVVWKTDIENDDLTAAIRKLSTISKENIEDIETFIKKLQILDDIWQSILDEPKDLVKGFLPIFHNLIEEVYPEYEFEDSDIEDFIKERIKELIPAAEEVVIEGEPTGKGGYQREITIGADTFGIKNSYQILVNTAEWLMRKGKLKREECPIPSGHKRYLISIQPKHRYGDDFRAPKKLSNGLYIETHYSTANCINKARRLLERYGYAMDILKIR